MHSFPEALLLNDNSTGVSALPRREHSQRRWVRSVVNLAINDRYEICALEHRGYGEVHPRLAAVLDPGIRDLQGQLAALGRLLDAEELES